MEDTLFIIYPPERAKARRPAPARWVLQRRVLRFISAAAVAAAWRGGRVGGGVCAAGRSQLAITQATAMIPNNLTQR